MVAEVRSDYTDTANDGIATGAATEGVVTSATPGNAIITKLRAQGILDTLEDLPGYDDSTGLGSPDAPGFIRDFIAAEGTTPPVPDTNAPALLLVIGVVLAGAVGVRRTVTVRRRSA